MAVHERCVFWAYLNFEDANEIVLQHLVVMAFVRDFDFLWSLGKERNGGERDCERVELLHQREF